MSQYSAGAKNQSKMQKFPFNNAGLYEQKNESKK